MAKRYSNSGLGDVLRALKEETGLSLNELSVLAPLNDPFRLDTPANHKLGEWFAEKLKAAGYLSGDDSRVIHLRGLHYILVTKKARRPDGLPYKNDEANWIWLVNRASKAARWLGYVPFERIIDERNAPPIIREAEEYFEPSPSVRLYGAPAIPNLTTRDLRPEALLGWLESPQKFRLAFFGEKVSLEAVLGPLAEEVNADLFLASGEQTITHIHTVAQHAVEDGRELIVFVFAEASTATGT